MKMTDINPMPEYFDRYINLCEDVDLDQEFANSLRQLNSLDVNLLSKLNGRKYLPGKWTVNDIIQHITDIERLLCAGVLRFARGEDTYVISFNEEEIAKNANADKKEIIKLIDELITVRKSTISLYKGFDYTDYFKAGINWKYKIRV